MARKLKKPVVIGIYGLSFCMLLGGILMLEVGTKQDSKKSENEQQYVSETVLESEDVPVVAEKTTIIRPYNDSSVKVLKNYYNYKDDASKQEESIIYYENTYMPSSGISYGNGKTFSVVSILDGTVKEVKEDADYGNIIIVEHDKGIVSTYESVTDIKVKKGDTIKQGDVIGSCGESNISNDLGKHLYFELTVNNDVVNPEDYYDKSVDEL